MRVDFLSRMPRFTQPFVQTYPDEKTQPSISDLVEIMDGLAELTTNRYGGRAESGNGLMPEQGWINRTSLLPSGMATYSVAYWLGHAGASRQERLVTKAELMVDVRLRALNKGFYDAIGKYVRTKGFQPERRGLEPDASLQL